MIQWINGSFISHKKEPKDIDFVTFLDYRIINHLSNKLDSFNYPQSEKTHNVDAYIIIVYPEDHPNRFYTTSDQAYWTNQFTKTKRNNRGNKLSKGFLEIIF